MPLRPRAHVVCTECHSRKVKCDLQAHPDGPCRHCRRSGQPCVPRDGVRKKTRRTTTSTGFQIDGRRSVTAGRQSLSHTESQHTSRPSSNPVTPRPTAFVSSSPVLQDTTADTIGHCATEYYGPHAELISTSTENGILAAPDWRGHIFASIQAHVLPRPTLQHAWTDAYLNQVYYHCPVVDRHEIQATAHDGDGSSIAAETTPPIILLKAAALVGMAAMHHPSHTTFLREGYERLKVLITLGFETDRLNMLKALCLISCHGSVPTSPSATGAAGTGELLNGPGHWTDIAIRQMLLMGLHRRGAYAAGGGQESEEVARRRAGGWRRIFWFLHNCDIFQSACGRRPYLLLHAAGYDVSLPTLDDFVILTPADRLHALVFLETTKLYIIMGKVVALQQQQKQQQQAQPGPQAGPPATSAQQHVDKITKELQAWLQSLPDELVLFDCPMEAQRQQQQHQRQAYSRPVSELMILYFVSIVYLETVRPTHTPPRAEAGFPPPPPPPTPTPPRRAFSTTSLLASSCAVALLDEMLARNDAARLPWQTGSFCLVLALPLIHHVAPPHGLHGAGSCLAGDDAETIWKARRNGELDTLRSVMRDLRPTYGDAETVVRMISGLQASHDSSNSAGAAGLRANSEEEGGEGEVEVEAEVHRSCGGPPASRELFPFPRWFCENMVLLDHVCDSGTGMAVPITSAGCGMLPADAAGGTAGSEVLVEWRGPADDAMFEFSLMDLYGMDFGHILF
ncbi:uncharacterized protein B0I36DRAFT_387199 [Microdochium trichocladiopsis]|uniref:Zn(2)-C6 fungal-type domain-containing protein n=1 Tax=Microdochium trichocladiopsis TaxID=1682393 RepID=A0A9P8XY41_9PEZI|nr:uncharacterized protein B0I36DRAFT_387199 [Microdochium trichocladiopsis]KAH7024695.1 hypothetical protein B0I36DRAFT_387199 [Microdochium trichocladiopsis]